MTVNEITVAAPPGVPPKLRRRLKVRKVLGRSEGVEGEEAVLESLISVRDRREEPIVCEVDGILAAPMKCDYNRKPLVPGLDPSLPANWGVESEFSRDSVDLDLDGHATSLDRTTH